MGRKGPRPKTYNHFQVTLDKFLGSKNLWRKPIAKDGSCLFRAVAEQVLLTQTYHHQVRLQCADYISRHRDDFKEFLTVKVDEYLRRLRDGQLWGGEVELVVFSKMYRRSIVVFNQQENQVQEQIFYSPEDEAAGRRPEDLVDPIFLAYSDGNHYDSVYMKRHKSNMAFCQSVVYSLLYEKVFEESLSQSSKQRLKTLYDSEVQKLATEDKGDKFLTFLSKTYPIGVLEGMGQNCFSNTPLHVYQRERESIEQQDRSVAAAIQFQVGDKCQVPVPGEPSCYYNGEVSSAIKPNGCHMVYIFDVGEQWEIPCKDITVPTPSPSPTSAASARRSGGPPQAWSKVHQRIQPSLSRARQGSDDAPPPPAPSLPLPLPDHLLPIPTTASHLHVAQHTQLPLPATPSATATELNHTVPKTHQSLPKASNVTRLPPSSKSHSTKVTSGVPVSAMAPRVTVAKVGAVEGGVALQRVVRKPGDTPIMEHQARAKEDRLKTSGQPQGRVPTLSTGTGGGPSLLGSAPPGFPVTKDPKILPKVLKISEGEKQPNLGRVTVPDPAPSNTRNPTDVKFIPQTPPVPVPSVASAFNVDPKISPASFPAIFVKTPAGPRGSLSTSDESASSSDESSNGLPPGNTTQSTASTAPVPLAFFGHPMGRYMLPVLPEGRPTAQIPTNNQNAQVASVLEGPRMHAPMPHSQPPRPLVQTSTTGSPQSVRPPAVGVSPQQQNLPQTRSEAGRDSPYLDPQVREARSSQPEEAWPLVGEEELHSREKLQDAPSSSSTGPLPARLMFPFGIPPATPDQAMSMMRQAHMAPHHRPPRMPATANPTAVPVSMQQVFPFLFAHQPFPAHQPHPPHLEVETDSKEVQTAPAPEFLPPPPMRDQEVDVRPATTSRGIQCGRVIKKEMKTQTDIGGIDMPLLLTEDIKPPTLDEEPIDMDRQIEVITQYVKQCLELYARSDPDGALPLQALVDDLGDCIQSTLQLKEKGLREEVREELREAVWEEVREEVREAVREEVRQEMEEAAVTSHKPLNMDEQNFLQLFTNAQQGLPESFQGGRMVPLEEHGRQWGPLPPHLNAGGPSNQEKPPPSVPPLRNESEDQPFVKTDGREDNASLQPHQEASVPPFPQMAPGPMMVPPGARPMVVTMPGMPPMGWYPYMPLPMFMTPQMNMLPHVMPPIAPEQGPDEQPMVQSEALSANKGVEPTEEPGPHAEEVSIEEGAPDEVSHPCIGPNQERGEGGVKVASKTTSELPSAFPSADLQNDADISEGESPAITAHGPPDSGTKESSIHPTTLEMVTPQATQYAQNLDDISPSTEPATASLLPGDDQSQLSLSAQVTKDHPQAPQPGLPCRRRDINDIDRALEEGEQGQGREEKTDTPSSPHTQQKQNPKVRSRQSGSHRNKPRDGPYHGAGKSQSKGFHGRQGQRYATVHPVDGSPVPTPPLHQSPAVTHPSSSSEPRPTSPTQLKSSTFNQPQLQASSSPVSGTAGVKNGEEASAKPSAEGVKGSQPAGRDGGTGTKGTLLGGKGGGGRGGKGGRGKGGKDTAPGSKTTTEGTEQVPTKIEERVKVESSTGDTSEGKTGRPRSNYQKSGFKQKEGRKVSGGVGGYRSHRSQQQNTSQPNSSGNQDGDVTSNSQPQRPKGGGGGGGGKPGKWGEGKKTKKVTTAAIPDSASTQQEPTRSGRSTLTSHTPLVTDCTLPKPLPSFKNLYSSSPRNEGRDFSPPVQEDSWPCLATTVVAECDVENHTSPYQYSPGSPTLAGVSKQSSPPNSSFPPTPPIYAQCTFDSTLSHHDVWSWTSADDALKFFPALRTTATIDPPT